MNLAIESRLALNEESVDTYNEKGYFLPKHAIFTEEKFTRLKDIFEELLIKKGDDLDHAHFDEPRLFEFLISLRYALATPCLLPSSIVTSKVPNPSCLKPFESSKVS